MNIESFMKNDDNDGARITLDSSWMVWDNVMDEWCVYTRKYKSKNTTTVYHGKDIERALVALSGR